MALPPYDPKFTMACSSAPTEYDHEHDASESAAAVAAELISYARLSLKLDSVRTEYSAQYLLDTIPCRHTLTVKGCLEFAIKNGIPKAEDWPLLGSMATKPPPSFKPDLVSMKGQVVEPEELEDALDLLKIQAVGAKLHVFSPHIELQQDAIYCGPSGEPARYVGLRDGVIVAVEKIYGKSIATVKVWYKKQFITVKVALSRAFASVDLSKATLDMEFTLFLVDFCVPRLSID